MNGNGNDKGHHVEAIPMDSDNPVIRAMAILIWAAMQGGCDTEDESMTMMFPSVPMGKSPETAKECGDWEIRVKKVGDGE
jgi:hypothetical protein